MTTHSLHDFEAKLPAFEKRIGITFKNIALLKEALTHRSASKLIRKHRLHHNERLEFLGDAVLKLIVSHYLFQELSDSNEGKLTKIRAYVVSDHFLVKLSKIINIGDYMLFSYGEIQTGGQKRHSTLANAFEAVLGAIYLDQGLDEAHRFFFSYFSKTQLNLEEFEQKDYKSILQEYYQKNFKELPEYPLLKEEGPEHEKKFYVHLTLPDHDTPFEGIGPSKKMAEQRAAYLALEWLNLL